MLGGDVGLEQLTVVGSGEAVPARVEVIADPAKRSERLLRLYWWHEALQYSFSAAGGAMGVLRLVGEPLVALTPVLRPGQHPS